MSLSQSVEMAVSGRQPSTAPAEAAFVLLGIETRTEAQEQRFAQGAHWAYGTIWGLGQLPLRPLREPERSLLYFLAVWSAGVLLLTKLSLSPPPTRWSRASLLTDLAHHTVYVAAVGFAFKRLVRGARYDP